jgi:prephenate dehydrogenase
MTPEGHDRAVAASSHLPHLVAVALAEAVPVAALPLTAGGYRDSTRIAAGDPELWTQILLNNRQHVVEALAPFEDAVAELRRALETEDRALLKESLRKAKSKRDALGN